MNQLCLVLHAHVPYGPPGSEAETWFAEAAVESWLPVARALSALHAAGVPVRLTVSFSPTALAWMEHHPGAVLAEVQHRRTRLNALAAAHPAAVRAQLDALEALARELDAPDPLLGPWRRLQESGVVELITTAATHGFLPLLSGVDQAVRAQLEVGLAAHQEAWDRRPAGLWLPECGYFPGLDEALADAQVRFTFVEATAFEQGQPPASTAAPIFLPTGVAAFGRDPGTSELVWSASAGYPGHGDYLEFHHRDGGERVWSVAGTPYAPATAIARAVDHAQDFVAKVEARQGELVTAPYDFELFGHWWHEGPTFLAEVLRAAQGRLQLVTPSQVLAEAPVLAVSALPDSSWGRGGGRAVWLSPENAWVWPHLERAAEHLGALARGRPRSPALGALERELLLAQASDWPFLLEARTSAGFARERVEAHLLRFQAAATAFEAGAAAEAGTSVPFPWLDGSNFGAL